MQCGMLNGTSWVEITVKTALFLSKASFSEAISYEYQILKFL